MDLIFTQKINDLCSLFPASWESADRTPYHNHVVGGAPNSWHLRGLAVDLVFDNTALLLRAAQYAMNEGIMGIEVDFRNNHLHLDGRVIPWHVVYYNEGGKKVEKSLKEYLTSLTA